MPKTTFFDYSGPFEDQLEGFQSKAIVHQTYPGERGVTVMGKIGSKAYPIIGLEVPLLCQAVNSGYRGQETTERISLRSEGLRCVLECTAGGRICKSCPFETIPLHTGFNVNRPIKV